MMPKVRASAALKPPGDLRQPVLDIFAIGVERRARGKLFENRPQVDLFARLLEFLDMFLKAVGNRQIERPMKTRLFALAVASPRSRRSWNL
jgi:hypothetical protein